MVPAKTNAVPPGGRLAGRWAGRVLGLLWGGFWTAFGLLPDWASA